VRVRKGLVRAGIVVAAFSLMAACGSSTSSTPATESAQTATASTQASTPSGGADAGTPAAANVMTVLGVQKVAPGPPEPGVAAIGKLPVDQRPPLPARYSDSVGSYAMAIETIASAAPSTSGLVASPGCTESSVFKRGMRVVFRFQIYDLTTGKVVTDRDGADAQIALTQGNDVQAYFAPRGEGEPGPDSPWTWVGVWNVPTDYPLGALPYTVSLKTAEGQTVTINPMSGDGLPIQIVD
jgi:hypothetical protein